MTRTYARNEARYDRKLIDMMVADGFATAFETAKGTIYVLKTDHGSVKVTADQIFDVAPEDQPIILVEGEVFDDNAAEAALAEAETRDSAIQEYKKLAADAGMSVAEYTDGEYYIDVDGRVACAEDLFRAERAAKKVSRFDRLDAAMGRFA